LFVAGVAGAPPVGAASLLPHPEEKTIAAATNSAKNVLYKCELLILRRKNADK
jgi:hypothetical protein